jgi:hypothetical protein
MIRLKRETLGSQFARLQGSARLFLQSARGQVQALDNSLQACPLAVSPRFAICQDVRGTSSRCATLQPGDSFSEIGQGASEGQAQRFSCRKLTSTSGSLLAGEFQASASQEATPSPVYGERVAESPGEGQEPTTVTFF